jgi:hypothetical protein
MEIYHEFSDESDDPNDPEEAEQYDDLLEQEHLNFTIPPEFLDKVPPEILKRIKRSELEIPLSETEENIIRSSDVIMTFTRNSN